MGNQSGELKANPDRCSKAQDARGCSERSHRIPNTLRQYANVANANASLEQSRAKLRDKLPDANALVASLRIDLETANQTSLQLTKSQADLVLLTNLQKESRMLRETNPDKTATLQGRLDLIVAKHDSALLSLEQKDAPTHNHCVHLARVENHIGLEIIG